MHKLAALADAMLRFIGKHRALAMMIVIGTVLIVPRFTFAQELTDIVTDPFDTIALLLAAVIQNVTAALGRLMLKLIEMILVVLQYNTFSKSHIVDIGWSLVRDVVNMAVVAILMALAVMTIVGSSKANWTQQLPRLFIAVVLVNFSRTICGFLIDISQIVMMTFFNAIIDIAAGNFAQLLALQSFGEFNKDFIDNGGSPGNAVA